MSKSLGARAPLPRLAGVPFFQEAVALMFDSSGRLLSEPSLATAQCLVLLELHEIAASHSWTKHYRYFGESIHPHYLPITCETRLGSRLLIYVIMTLVHSPIISVIFPIFFSHFPPIANFVDLAFQLLEDALEVHKPDSPNTAMPATPEALNRLIERECTRRCFWLIQAMEWINTIYTYKPIRVRSFELIPHVRLPIDETNFELAVDKASGESYGTFA